MHSASRIKAFLPHKPCAKAFVWRGISAPCLPSRPRRRPNTRRKPARGAPSEGNVTVPHRVGSLWRQCYHRLISNMRYPPAAEATHGPSDIAPCVPCVSTQRGPPGSHPSHPAPHHPPKPLHQGFQCSAVHSNNEKNITPALCDVRKEGREGGEGKWN